MVGSLTRAKGPARSLSGTERAARSLLQAREGEQLDPGPLGRRAEPGSRKFGSQGGPREPARRGNAWGWMRTNQTPRNR
jgi:hypothetical protein